MNCTIRGDNPPPELVFEQSLVAVHSKTKGNLLVYDNYSLPNGDVRDFASEYSLGKFGEHRDMTPGWTPTETVVLRKGHDLQGPPSERRIIVPRRILELMATWYDNPDKLLCAKPMCMNFTASLMSGDPTLSMGNMLLASECITKPEYYDNDTGLEKVGDVFALFSDVKEISSVPRIGDTSPPELIMGVEFIHSFVLAALARQNRDLNGQDYFASKLDIRKPGFHPLHSLVEIYAPDEPSYVMIANKKFITRTSAYRNAAR